MFARILTLTLTLAVASPALAAKSAAKGDILSRLAAIAIASDDPAADRAIDALRARGPEGLKALLALLDDASLRRAGSKGSSTTPTLAAEEARIQGVIDRVAGQRYAHLSRMYWYTDLEAAKAAAAAGGKPILSLRMLGGLTDEFSCANSRFFRTTLYVNKEISRRLSDDFVLHWKSVRPVPRVTIDFGDGRKLERTVTGNSAHYVLAADGTPLDVLPGLYGPEKFGAWLQDVKRLHAQVRTLTASERGARVQAYHAERGAAIERRWARDFLAAEASSPVAALQQAMPIAAREEIDRRVDASRPVLDARTLLRLTTPERWEAMARLPEHRVALDAATRRVIARENPDAVRAGERAVTKAAVAAEAPLLALMTRLQSSIAADGVRNEYTLHRQAHEWFARGELPDDVERLNDRVYAELFLTPNDDPWLGLVTPETYTALENGGVVAASP
jgi:hypothetical protein